MKSSDIKNIFKIELRKATTINELVWIDTEYKQEERLAWEDLLELIRTSREKREAFETEGQIYTRATKPAWR